MREINEKLKEPLAVLLSYPRKKLSKPLYLL
jgi:hypothetical protein